MDDGSESSWMSTWTGGDKEEEEEFNPRGQIGDWSSFMIAMDDNDGQELHRSLSSMNIKFNKNNTNSGNSTPTTIPTANTSFNNLNKFKQQPLQQSGSLPGSPNINSGSPSQLKGSSNVSTPVLGSPLKSSLGLTKPTIAPSSPPPQSSNPNRPLIGTTKNNQASTSTSSMVSSISSSGSSNTSSSLNSSSPQQPQTSTKHHQQFARLNLQASIHFEQFNLNGSTGNSSGTSPVGSPLLSSSPLSSSPHSIPKSSLGGSNSNTPNKDGVSSSPPLSSSKDSETSFLSNIFHRKKKEKERSFQSNFSTTTTTTINTSTTIQNTEINDGNSSLSSNTQYTYYDDDVLSHTSGLEISMNSDKLYEGWMEVYISKKWKKKWFVLRGIHLEYYKGWWEDQQQPQQSNDSDECGKILLNYWYTFSKIALVDGKYTFSIIQSTDVEKNSGKKDSKLKFRLEEENIAKKWIDECEKVIKKRKETTVTLRPLAEHRQGGGIFQGRGRSNTVAHTAIPSFDIPAINTNSNESSSYQSNVCIPHEMIDCLEPDEKILLEKVKSLLDEFKPKPLPQGETPTSYRNKPRSSDGYYRVLSLDGGGLRSVMVCILVERLAKRYPKFLDHIDVFTGTSAGSIVAAGLAFEYPPKGTRRVLELTALPVFGKKRPGFNMGNAKYFARVLRASCYVFFQDRRFYEAQRKLVVPAFQLDCQWPPESQSLNQPEVRRWQPRVFHNIGKCEGYLETDVIGDVLLRSASAPTYFPSYQGYIDGGVFANNPSLSAISLAMSPSLDNIPADKIICLSIGTGASSHYMEGGQDYDWGLLNWAPKLGNLLMGSQVDYLTQLCDNILGERHHRLNPVLGENTSMDDPKLVTELATLANTIDLTKTFEFIEKYFILPEDKLDQQTNDTTTSSLLSPRSLNGINSSTGINNSTGINGSTGINSGSGGNNLDSPRNVTPRNLDSPRNVSPRNSDSPRNISPRIPIKNLDDDTSIPLTPR